MPRPNSEPMYYVHDGPEPEGRLRDSRPMVSGCSTDRDLWRQAYTLIYARAMRFFLRLFLGNSCVPVYKLTEEHGSELRVLLSCGAVQSASGSAPTPQKGSVQGCDLIGPLAHRGISGCLRSAPEHERASAVDA